MKRMGQSLITFIFLLCLTTLASADVIATGDIWTGSIHRPPDLEEATLNLYMHTGSEIWSDWTGGIQADDFLFHETITPSSTGSTFFLESGPNFDAAVSLLTNGINDYIVYGTQSDALHYDFDTGQSNWVLTQDFGYVMSENSIFSLTGGPVSFGDPVQDFSNYAIDRIALTITDLEWFNYDEVWRDGTTRTFTRIDLSGTLSIEGSPVPEPATMMFFGIGLLGFAGVSRHKK